MKILVLGTEYTIREDTPENNMMLENLAGYCDWSSKEIVINSDITKKTLGSYEKTDKFKEHVIRHEIIHAFLEESGLNEYSKDETLVDWIAYQLPKINECLQQIIGIYSLEPPIKPKGNPPVIERI